MTIKYETSVSWYVFIVHFYSVYQCSPDGFLEVRYQDSTQFHVEFMIVGEPDPVCQSTKKRMMPLSWYKKGVRFYLVYQFCLTVISIVDEVKS